MKLFVNFIYISPSVEGSKYDVIVKRKANLFIP